MIKTGLLFVALTLTALSGFSQQPYPIRQIIGKDTVAVFHINQVRAINLKLESLSECKEARDSLKKEVNLYEDFSQNQSKIIARLESKLSIGEEITRTKDEIILVNEKLLKKEKIKSRLFLAIGLIFGAVAVVK